MTGYKAIATNHVGIRIRATGAEEKFIDVFKFLHHALMGFTAAILDRILLGNWRKYVLVDWVGRVIRQRDKIFTMGDISSFMK